MINIDGLILATTGGGIAAGSNFVFNGDGSTAGYPPVMSGTRDNNGVGGGGSGYPWPVNSMYTNVGNRWNGTRFTADTAGLYYCNLSCIAAGGASNDNSTTAAFYAGLVKNGGSYAYGHVNGGNSWYPFSFTCLVILAVGDYLEFTINASPGQVGNSSGAWMSGHSAYTIAKIG